MNAVTVENISKNYRIYSRPSARLKELIFRRRYHRDFWALREVGFQVEQGATFGIVGENGSGKSTLLQIIAGTMTPTTGSVALSGRVAALLELGSGFNTEFTGRENAFLNAAIMGLSQDEIERKMPEIERFAEIGSFMDQTRQDLFQRHVRAPGLCHRHQPRPRDPAGGRGSGGRGRLFPAALRAPASADAGRGQDHPAGLPRRGRGQEPVRCGRLAGPGQDQGSRRPPTR